MVDDDLVSLSNLQRQVIHATRHVGGPKVESAAATIGAAQSACRGRDHAVRLDADNALDLVSRYDLVVDGSDNFSTRYLVSDACYLASKPLVTGAVGIFDGTLTTIRAHERDGRKKSDLPLPVSRPPPPEAVPACAEAGILGALPACSAR